MNIAWVEFFKALLQGIRELLPALGVFVYDAMTAKIARVEQEKRDLQYAQKIKENHAKVDGDTRSDVDVVNSIANGKG